MRKLLTFIMAFSLVCAVAMEYTTHRFSIWGRTVSISVPDTFLAGYYYSIFSENDGIVWLPDSQSKSHLLQLEVINWWTGVCPSADEWESLGMQVHRMDTIVADSTEFFRLKDLYFYRRYLSKHLLLEAMNIREDERECFDSIFRSIRVESGMHDSINYRKVFPRYTFCPGYNEDSTGFQPYVVPIIFQE